MERAHRLSADDFRGPIPLRALILSGGALAVPVLATVVFPEIPEYNTGFVIWLPALVPAFLLAYHRGLRGAAVALAAGMATLSLTQVITMVLGFPPPNWPLLLIVIINFLVITMGIAVFAELLHRERRVVEQLALMDSLTGLPNRRYAELALTREFAAAVRGRQIGVAVYDIDHFKQFNDKHGHAAGDEVLREFGDVLATLTRRQNVSARYGGEEFLSVVSDVDLGGMRVFVERVREGIKERELKWGTVTVSVGVAQYQPGMGSHEVMVAAADRALYAAKAAGRDRVEIARDEAPAVRRPSLTEAPLRVQQRVLVVDAEPEVRNSIASVLRGSGYDVLETGSPEEAIDMLSNPDQPIELLVTSVMMPRTSGFTMVDRVTEPATDVRVVYLSDSMRERVSWPGAPGRVKRFVAKPVEPEQLLATVREAMEEEIQ
jgi:diguanylate cyclase (GGDEF)-like protein